MEPKDSFEKKIKSKVAEFSPAPEPGAWQDFVPRLNALNVPIWKRWYAPYIYTTGLFFLAWLAFAPQAEELMIGDQAGPKAIVQSEPLVIRDTVYVYDTVYIIKKEVIITQQALSASANSRLEESSDGPESKADFEKQAFEGEITQSRLTQNSSAAEGTTHLDSIEKVAVNTLHGIQTSEKIDAEEISLSAHSASQDSTALVVQKKAKRPTAMTAAPIERNKIEVLKSTKEYVVGDTSNLSSGPVQTKTKKRLALYVKPSVNLLFQVHDPLEFYPSLLPEISAELRWNETFGLAAGVIFGETVADLDDAEDFPEGFMNSFPGLEGLDEVPDDMEIRNRQLWLPLFATFRPSAVGRFDISFQGGLMLNYLNRQTFKYDFDDESGIEDFSRVVNSREWKLSHAMMAVGSGYALSERLSLDFRVSYWLPLSPTGVDQSRIHGLGVNFGLDYRLWQRKPRLGTK